MESDQSEAKRQNKTLNVGAMAVVHADETRATTTSPPNPKAAKIGAFAIAKMDEKLLEPGEHLVTVVRRHPIGIFGIYAEMTVGIIGIIALALLSLYSFFRSLSGSDKGLIAAGAIFVIGFMVALLLISTYVYRQSRLVVSDKSVIQVLQKALFNRKISRLSMSNVEDVNVEQKGILQTWFNYGTLTIQTAGQEDNFVFPFCPDPDNHANRILEARQQYVHDYGEHNEDAS